MHPALTPDIPEIIKCMQYVKNVFTGVMAQTQRAEPIIEGHYMPFFLVACDL